MKLHRSPDTPSIIWCRNRGAFMVGASWVHDPRWCDGFRLAHFYLGWFTLTVRTVAVEAHR